MKKGIVILVLLSLLGATSCERKYYTITKDELNQMERRVIKMESRIMDLYEMVPYNSEAYDKVDELKEQADLLINDIGCVIDADRNL